MRLLQSMPMMFLLGCGLWSWGCEGPEQAPLNGGQAVSASAPAT